MTKVTGGPGPDSLYGDTIWRADLLLWVTAPTADEIFGYAGNDTIEGYSLSDTLWGGADDDILRGGDGNDTLYGEAGDDILQGDGSFAGDTGDDVLDGGDGNDYLNGGDGNDTLTGGDGDDELFGNAPYPDTVESDMLLGGAGNDRLVATSGATTIDGGTGTDIASVYFLTQTAAVTFVALTPGATVTPLVGGTAYGSVTNVEAYAQIWGGKGNDRLGAAYVLPVDAQYTLSGQDGDDTAVLDFSAETGRMRGGFGNGYGYLQNADTMGVLQVIAEHIEYRGNALDGISAGDGNDTLIGLSGDDQFHGGNGHDTIDGAGGNDTIYGGDGNDRIAGGAGTDTIDGQTGTDTAVFSGKFASYSFTFSPTTLQVTGPEGTDTLTDIEALEFADGTVQVTPTGLALSSFAISPATVLRAEGHAGTTTFSFTVTRSGATALAQSIAWSAAGVAGSGTMPAATNDFAGNALPAGTLTFAAGQAIATITVAVQADTQVELNERFAVTLGPAPAGATIVKASADGVILNDDSRFDLATLSADKPEGSGNGVTPFTFTITASGYAGTARTIGYSVHGIAGGATAAADGLDFDGNVLPAGTITFAANETSRTLTIGVRADNALEFDEDFAVTLAPVSQGTVIGTGRREAIIHNDDSRFDLSYIGASSQKPEGNGGGTTPFTFTVSSTGDTSGSRTIGYSVHGVGDSSDPYATHPVDGADFLGGTLPTGTVTFAPGETTQSIVLPVVADDIAENTEGIRILLTYASPGTSIGKGAVEGLIYNDDTNLSIFPRSIGQAEGNSGAKPYLYTVTRTGVLTGTSTVAWNVVPHPDSPTTTGADFTGGTLPQGSLTFAKGETTATITVNVAGDTLAEPHEAFRVLLSNPTGATITEPMAGGMIWPDDTEISIAPLSASKPEGTGGVTTFTFRLTRTGDIGDLQLVNYAVAGVAGAGTVPATAADFADKTLAGTVGFAPGAATTDMEVHVAADDAGELNERFAVTLSNPPAGATLATATAEGIIFNDDTSVAISPVPLTRIEGAACSTATFTFSVGRSGNVNQTDSITWSLGAHGLPGTADATADDFAGGTLPAGDVLTFAPGEAVKTVTVAIAGDNLPESTGSNDSFSIVLSNPSAGLAITNATAFGIIANDDTRIDIVALSASKPEGSGGSTPFTFTVTRTGALPASQTVKYAVGATTIAGTVAADAADFGGALPSGTITFAQTEASRVLTIAVAADLAGELNESFAVALSNPGTGATLGTAKANGIIYNDDISLRIAPVAATQKEGNAGTTTYSYTVSRAGNVGGETSVDWSFAGGGVAGTATATAPDFAGGTLPVGQRLTFAAKETTKTITIQVAGDTSPEGGLNESFTIALSNPTAGTAILAASATGTILDDDAIYGTAGNDILSGTAGADLFILGEGQDIITAGAGTDLFRFLPKALGAGDVFVVTDFSRADGERLDLSRIDAIAGTPADDPFSFIGTAAFSGAGQLRWQQADATHVAILGSTTGTTPNLTIVLAASGPVDRNWLVL